MKQLTCEMCGSNDLVKQDGVFVCQSCGCKYSVEEAKKMMVEGTVEVTGTVKVDDEKETLNLKQLASNAKNRKDYKEAAKYYNELLLKEPNSWEANYYTVYAQAMDIKVGEIPNEITRVSNNIPTVFSLINKSNYTSFEKVDIIKEIGKSFFELTILFFENYKMEGSSETRIKILEAQEDFYMQICDHFSDDKEFMDAYGTHLLTEKIKGNYLYEEEILKAENHLYYTHDCKNVYRPSDFVQGTVKKTNARCKDAIKQSNPQLHSKMNKDEKVLLDKIAALKNEYFSIKEIQKASYIKRLIISTLIGIILVVIGWSGFNVNTDNDFMFLVCFVGMNIVFVSPIIILCFSKYAAPLTKIEAKMILVEAECGDRTLDELSEEIVRAFANDPNVSFKSGVSIFVIKKICKTHNINANNQIMNDVCMLLSQYKVKK